MRQELEELDTACGNSEFTDILRSVSAEVLETMFFTEAVSSECEHGWLEMAVSARVGFAGSHLGQMRVGVCPEAVVSIGSAFLGLDPQEASDQERSQVILELANIVCGAVLSRLWPESKLQLDAPESTSWDGGEDAMHCCLELPEGKVAISIRLLSQAEGPQTA
jgi:CheY-specific phosphatase CheX